MGAIPFTKVGHAKPKGCWTGSEKGWGGARPALPSEDRGCWAAVAKVGI